MRPPASTSQPHKPEELRSEELAVQECEPQPRAEPQPADGTITGGTDSWKPQKTELDESWKYLTAYQAAKRQNQLWL